MAVKLGWFEVSEPVNASEMDGTGLWLRSLGPKDDAYIRTIFAVYKRETRGSVYVWYQLLEV